MSLTHPSHAHLSCSPTPNNFPWCSRPVRPGDELRVESEILEARPLKSRDDRGMVKVKTTTLNQRGEAVQVLVYWSAISSCRDAKTAPDAKVRGRRAS